MVVILRRVITGRSWLHHLQMDAAGFITYRQNGAKSPSLSTSWLVFAKSVSAIAQGTRQAVNKIQTHSNLLQNEVAGMLYKMKQQHAKSWTHGKQP